MTNKHLKKTKSRKGLRRNTSRRRYTKRNKTNRNNTKQTKTNRNNTKRNQYIRQGKCKLYTKGTGGGSFGEVIHITEDGKQSNKKKGVTM